MKEFFGKAVLSMAAQGGLLHGAVQQTEKKLFSAEGGMLGRMGGNPATASGTGFGDAKSGGPEKRRHIGAGRLQLRNGWIYVNLRNKTFRAERGAGRWGRRSGGAVHFFMGRHGRGREEGS